MSKINLEAFKLSKAQMNNVNGGKEESESTCRRLQEQANGSESKNWDSQDWLDWSNLWELNCQS